MKSIKTTILAIVAALTLGGCNDIPENERFIELPPVEAKRIVLLEEYTGQLCVNCPSAHKEMARLLGDYPENLIAVSIHAGGAGNSIGEGEREGIVGLRIPEGEVYAANAGVSTTTGFPKGVVNRNTGAQTPGEWAASIRSAIEKPSRVEVAISVEMTETEDGGGMLEMTTRIEGGEAFSGNLVLWVIEDGIVAPQRDIEQGLIPDYVHNHVLRACINGVDGEAVNVKRGENAPITHKIAVKNNWNADRLSVVAFIYTASGVEQATHASVH